MSFQITTNEATRQNAANGLTLVSNGKPVYRIAQKTAAAKKLFVFCELCAESAEAERSALQVSGWSLSSHNAFCPEHAEMV